MRNLSAVSILLVLAVSILTACTPVVSAAPADARPIEITHVSVEVGVGSPLPVHVVASGSWPDLCAQLAEVSQVIDGNEIEITLLATPAQADCPPDYLGLPFRLDVPLNIVQLREGAYTVSVNGITTTFDLPLAP